jgi:predicted membrane chloride channel (bestrophin family)
MQESESSWKQYYPKRLYKQIRARRHSTHRSWYIGFFAIRGTVFLRLLFRLSVLIVMTIVLNVCQYYKRRVPVIKPTAHNLVGVALGLLCMFIDCR